MSTVAVLRMARSDTYMAGDSEDISDSEINRRKDALDVDNNKTIHSGHFMLSRVHENGEEDEEEEPLQSPVVDVKPEGFDFNTASTELSAAYNFGHNVSIDGSLSKLFQCMTLAYSGKLTSPKFKLFKGLKLMVKEKLRLNNIIWREWHMQFIKSKRPVVCQFMAPLETDQTHSKPEAVVMEGKYWKRRLDTVTREYKKWRTFYKEKRSKHSVNQADMSEIMTHAELLENVSSYNRYRFAQRPPSPSGNDDNDFMMDFSDTLFTSLNQPFAFPDPREINYMINPDLLQPGLVQLQPNLEDFMDTSDLIQEMLRGTDQGSKVVTFTGQQGAMQFTDVTQNVFNTPEPDLLATAIELTGSDTVVPISMNSSDMRRQGELTWNTNNRMDTNTVSSAEITYTGYNAQQLPMNTMTFPAGTTISVVSTQPLPVQPAQAQEIPRTQERNAEADFAVPQSRPVRTRQRPIAPAPPAKQQPGRLQQLLQPNKNQTQNSTTSNLLAQILAQHQAQPQAQPQRAVPSLKVENQPASCQQISAQIRVPVVVPQSLRPRHRDISDVPPPCLSDISEVPPPSETQATLRDILKANRSEPITSAIRSMTTDDTIASILGLRESSFTAGLTNASGSFADRSSSRETDRRRHESDPLQTQLAASATINSLDFLDQSMSPETMSPDGAEHKAAFRPKTDKDRTQYKEARRAQHISAEQKRRVNIKSGFDMLHTLIPSLQQNANAKISKAQMLQKTADYCRKLKHDRKTMQEEADGLKQDTESLKDAISNCQAQLPATGAPVTRQRADQMQEMFEEYVKNRTLQNWKFWIFSQLIRSLFTSYNNTVSTASMEDLCRSVLAWVDQHCALLHLRTDVFNSLRELSTSTSILSNPGRVREEAIASVTKQERRNSLP